jgi:hypothetical protein
MTDKEFKKAVVIFVIYMTTATTVLAVATAIMYFILNK